MERGAWIPPPQIKSLMVRAHLGFRWGFQQWGFIPFQNDVDINDTSKISKFQGQYSDIFSHGRRWGNPTFFVAQTSDEHVRYLFSCSMVANKTLKDLKRKLDPEEALCTHLLPTTSKAARVAGAPKFNLEGISLRDQTVMAGNAMNVPCVAAFILSMVMCLERRNDG